MIDTSTSLLYVRTAQTVRRRTNGKKKKRNVITSYKSWEQQLPQYCCHIMSTISIAVVELLPWPFHNHPVANLSRQPVRYIRVVRTIDISENLHSLPMVCCIRHCYPFDSLGIARIVNLDGGGSNLSY